MSSFCVIALADLAALAVRVDLHNVVQRRVDIGPFLLDALLVLPDAFLGCQEFLL